MTRVSIVALIIPVLILYTCFTARSQDAVSGNKTVTITGVGDIMLGTLYPPGKYLSAGHNPYSMIVNAADTLRFSDVTFGNLEGAFLNEGEPAKKCRDTTICYLFRMPESYAGVLAYAGFDVLSLANNHFNDFGPKAAKRTMNLLDSLGIKYAGTNEVPFAIFIKDSVTYGFCAFATGSGSLNLNDIDKAADIVKMLDRKCNIVIVSFHGGAEGAKYQRVPRGTEYFYGENRGNVREFARKMIEAGADVIFGHGPHVPRAIELYNDRIICYSLGNFCTNRGINIAGPNGLAPVVKIKTDITGRFISGTIIPFFQTPDRKVMYDAAKRAVSQIRELTLLDFPDTGPLITNDGKILKR